MGNEFINTMQTALKELQRLERQHEKEEAEQAAWDNEIIAEHNATSKGEKRMDKRTRKKQVDKFKKVIGWRDSLCNDAGEMPVGRFLFTGEHLLMWSDTIKDGYDYTLSDCTRGLLSEKTARRWMARGQAASEQKKPEESELPYLIVWRAVRNGQHKLKERLRMLGSGTAFERLDPKDRIRAAQWRLAQIEKAEDPLRLAQIEKAQAEAMLARLKMKLLKQAEKMIDEGDLAGALKLIRLEATDQNGEG